MKPRIWLVPTLILVVPVGYIAWRVVTSPGIVDTKMDRARAEVAMFADVLEQYRRERGRYPATDEGFRELVRVGLIRKVPDDPWHHPYEYRFPGSRNVGGFDVWSYGADGKPGGEDADEDFGNWDDDSPGH